MKRNSKRSFIVVMVLLICTVATTCAFAACSHNWVYVGEGEPSGQFTEYRETTCSNSSTPHSHYRHVWGSTSVYQCSKCGETKETTDYVYGEWVCSLTDWGR
jgi:hypothetical protein